MVKKLFENCVGKQKMLVISIKFSFSPQDFVPFQDQILIESNINRSCTSVDLHNECTLQRRLFCNIAFPGID